MNDPFAAYKLPLGLAEGIEIPLPNTTAVFKVTLPSRSNDEYQMQLMAGLNITTSDDGTGTIDMEPTTFMKRRQQVFIDNCIISSKGLPNKLSDEEFFEAYPLAARLLFEKASELGVIADEEVDVALGKSSSLPNGNLSGAASSTSTKPLKKAASQSTQKGLN